MPIFVLVQLVGPLGERAEADQGADPEGRRDRHRRQDKGAATSRYSVKLNQKTAEADEAKTTPRHSRPSANQADDIVQKIFAEFVKSMDVLEVC